MRLLFYSWKANNEQILADNLIKCGFEIRWFDKECKHYTRDMELAAEMIPYINQESIEAVVSFNYFPIISMVCNTCQIPYFSWVYDSPHFTLYAKQIMLPCNHIGIFDREMVKHLQDTYQVPTVFYAPLAVDTEYFDRMMRSAQGADSTYTEKSGHGSEHVKGVQSKSGQRSIREGALAQYTCDVSFVGSLYTDEHNYYDMLGLAESGSLATGDDMPANSRAASVSLNQLLERQLFNYQQDHLRLALSSGKIDICVIKDKVEKHGLMLGEDYFANPEDILLAAVLEKKVTVEERRILLTEIAEGNFVQEGFSEGQKHNSAKQREPSFRLYTGSDTKKFPALDACNNGTVDYHSQMPLVFAASRINLNISLRSIHSGIPLRVLDIMACGGFVLSNWQPELAEYFTEGEELALFESKDECMEKIAYYLTHEDKRREIAAAGKQKVQEMFSYEKGLERLFGVP